MNLNKTNSNIFKNKYFLFLFIFTFGIGILLYQVYVNSIQSSIIEGLNVDTSNPSVSNLLTKFSSLFENKCLTGCVRLDDVDKTKCEQKIDESNSKVYDCPLQISALTVFVRTGTTSRTVVTIESHPAAEVSVTS